MPGAPEKRWNPHPVGARVLQAVLLLVPLALATACGAAIARLFPKPNGLVSQVGWWALVLAVATLGLVIGNALIRRVLPLALMLQLTLVFPGRTPSRFAIALRAGSPKRLEAWARRVATEPTVAITPAKHAETVRSSPRYPGCLRSTSKRRSTRLPMRCRPTRSPSLSCGASTTRSVRSRSCPKSVSSRGAPD